MKILLIIETPEDDELHWKRVHRALDLYMSRIRANNEGDCKTSPIDDIGMNGGPNILECGGDVRVFEQRVDARHFKWKVYECLPKWARGLYAKFAWVD